MDVRLGVDGLVKLGWEQGLPKPRVDIASCDMI
jgi:hypothetical protein